MHVSSGDLQALVHLAGPGLLWPVLLAAMAVLLAWLWRRRPRLVALLGACGFGFTALYHDGSPAVRWFPEPDQVAGYYLLSLLGCLFAFRLARIGSLPALVFGNALLWLVGGLAIFDFGVRFVGWCGLAGQVDRGLLFAGLVAATVLWIAGCILATAGPWRRARSRTHGMCRDCGYDLRCSPVACPECGRPVAEPVRSGGEWLAQRVSWLGRTE